VTTVPPTYVQEECRHCGNVRRRLDGGWVRERREDLGLSLRELAQALGINHTYLRDMEDGRRQIPRDREREILEALESRGSREHRRNGASRKGRGCR
jgi:ribosome-binding protein aMBF1 (putative translation factor)